MGDVDTTLPHVIDELGIRLTREEMKMNFKAVVKINLQQIFRQLRWVCRYVHDPYTKP